VEAQAEDDTTDANAPSSTDSQTEAADISLVTSTSASTPQSILFPPSLNITKPAGDIPILSSTYGEDMNMDAAPVACPATTTVTDEDHDMVHAPALTTLPDYHAQAEAILSPVSRHLQLLKQATIENLPPQISQLRCKTQTQIVKDRLLPVGEHIVNYVKTLKTAERGFAEMRLCKHIAENYWPLPASLNTPTHLHIHETYYNKLYVRSLPAPPDPPTVNRDPGPDELYMPSFPAPAMLSSFTNDTGFDAPPVDDESDDEADSRNEASGARDLITKFTDLKSDLRKRVSGMITRSPPRAVTAASKITRTDRNVEEKLRD
jgi:hypothetical protein